MTSCRPPPTCIAASPIPDANDSRMSAIRCAANLTPMGPHPLQIAFVRRDALQCGYCTPGQIMSALALLRTGWPLDRDAVRSWINGNLCRCGAYSNIVDAVLDVAESQR